MDELYLYRVNTEYVNYLWQFTSSEASQIKNNEKNGRPRTYVGLLHRINDYNYLIPLSSPEKDKYGKMFERVDFMKIEDNGKLKCVIDIGFMIPVPDDELILIDIDREPPNMKHILSIERTHVRKRATEIIENAKETYKRVVKARRYKDRNDRLPKRCLDFPLLEMKMKDYIMQKQKGE